MNNLTKNKILFKTEPNAAVRGKTIKMNDKITNYRFILITIAAANNTYYYDNIATMLLATQEILYNNTKKGNYKEYLISSSSNCVELHFQDEDTIYIASSGYNSLVSVIGFN